MQDEAHVGLVDAESKCHSRHDHLHAACLPRLLHLLTLPRFASGVVACARDLALPQPLLHALGIGARESVDDASTQTAAGGGPARCRPGCRGGGSGCIKGIQADARHLVEQRVVCRRLRAHGVSYVGAVKVATEPHNAPCSAAAQP